MTYLPARKLRPSRLNEIAGPAIVFPEPGRTDSFLVTAGDPPFVCFIGGQYAGEGFEKAQAGRWTGIAIENVDLEVETSSAFKPAYIQQPLGALFRVGSGLEILIGTKDSHGFSKGLRVPVVGQLPTSSAEAEVGFTKWRAVFGEGANKEVLFEYEAKKTADL